MEIGVQTASSKWATGLFNMKTASRFPTRWTEFNQNMCKKEENQIAFLTGMKNNLTVIELVVYNPHKPKDESTKTSKKMNMALAFLRCLWRLMILMN